MEQVTNAILLVGEDTAMTACLKCLLADHSLYWCSLHELNVGRLREIEPRVVLFSSFKDKDRTIGAIDMVRWFSLRVATIIFSGSDPLGERRHELDSKDVIFVPKPETTRLVETILRLIEN